MDAMAPVLYVLAGLGAGLLLAVGLARWSSMRTRRDADRQVAAVLAATPAAVLEVDLDGSAAGCVVRANAQAASMFGQDVAGRPLRELLSFDDRHRVDQLLTGPPGGAVEHCALTVLAATGPLASHAVALVTVNPERGRVLDLVVLSTSGDADADAAAAALRDPLTGLAVRPLLIEHLTYALAARDRGRGEVALLHVDCGLGSGEAGLVADVAGRLRQSVRASDPLAHLSGDQFAVLCPDLDDADVAHRLADRLEGALGVPFETDDRSVQVSAAVGVGVGQPHQAPADLLADAAEDAVSRRRRRTG